MKTKFFVLMVVIGVFSIPGCSKEESAGEKSGGVTEPEKAAVPVKDEEPGKVAKATEDPKKSGICRDRSKPGFLCLPEGCPLGEFGENVQMEIAGTKSTLQISHSNSGGNDLDWSVTVAEIGETGKGKMPDVFSFNLLVPKGTKDKAISKFSTITEMRKTIKAGEPFAVSGMRLPKSGNFSLTVDPDCRTVKITYDLVTASGEKRKGELSFTRKACPPCE